MGWVLLYYTLEVFKWLVIIRAVLSWFVPPHSGNQLVVLLRQITDPILAPISRVLPNPGGVDLSPLIAFGIIWFLQGLMIGWM